MTVSNSAWRKQHGKQAKVGLAPDEHVVGGLSLAPGSQADAIMAERILNGELDEDGLSVAVGDTDEVEQAVSEEATAPLPWRVCCSASADPLPRK